MRLRLLFLLLVLIALTTVTLNIIRGNTIDKDTLSYLIPPNYAPGIAQHLAEVKQAVSAPGPLRQSLTEPGGTLTIQGIFIETNKQRAKENLPPLYSNPLLSQAAQNKLNDMIDRQYFDHINPDGVGPAELVSNIGYAYVRTGENLALGNFANDTDLVQSWMNSPGHRDNIMSKGFSEIGIATSPATFEGKQTWFAVQTFGLPITACPTINPTLRPSSQQKQSALEQLKAELTNLPTTYTDLAGQGQDKIKQGNQLIKQGNQLAQQQQSNEQAQTLWDQGEQLQKEGQSLINQAQAERDNYNAKVTTFNQLNSEYISLVDQINSQIKAYNDCVTSF